MKKILFLILLCFLIFGIYQVTKRKENLFFSIGNQNGDVYYSKEDLRIPEVTMSIEQNEVIADRPIQQILVKSSKIQIDSNSFVYLKDYDRILTQLKDLEELFIILRKYCKEKIEILLLKEDTKESEYVNKKISILCQKYDIIITR